MSTRLHLLRLADEYRAATGLALTTISKRAAGHARLIDRLREGCDITTRRAERALRWFHDHWLDDPDWPDWPAGIPRPDPAPDPHRAQAAAEPAPPADDPVHAVRALLDRIHTLRGPAASETIDWQAVTAAQVEMLQVAMRLRGDGQIASPNALCLALGVDRRVYDDVVHLYAGGRGGSKRPRGEDTDRRRVFDALIDADDKRFTCWRGVMVGGAP